MHVPLSFFDHSRYTAFGTECGAFFGAFFFLVGTLWYQQLSDFTGASYRNVLTLWMLGSIAFSAGAAHLTYRHAVLKLT